MGVGSVLVVGAVVLVMAAGLAASGSGRGDGPGRSDRELSAAPAAAGVQPSRGIARCSEAVTGSPDSNWPWRAGTAHVGRFGLVGGRRGFEGSPALVELKSGNWAIKKGALVRGRRPLIVRVLKSDRARVGLDYGGPNSESRIEDAHTAVKFRPCRRKAGTGWPGGLILTDLDPVILLVKGRKGATPRRLQVG